MQIRTLGSLFLAVTLVFSIAFNVVAEQVTVKGVGQTLYEGWSASKEDQQSVLLKAKINALERYVGDNKSRIKLFEKNRETILKDLDRYILSAKIVDQSRNKKTKQLTTVIKAEINTELLENVLEEGGGSAEGEYMTFIFVAREQKSIESQSTEQRSFENTKNQAKASKSATKIADKITYDVATSEEISSAMNNVFSEAGFEVVEAEYLEEESGGLLSIDAFKSDYREGDDLSSATLSSAVSGARSLEIPYMAIGTLNVGLHQPDPVSGLQRVYVTVSGKVLSLKKRFPKTLASVGPVQYAGLGPNPTVAKNNALSIAAEKAAEDLVAQLKVKLKK